MTTCEYCTRGFTHLVVQIPSEFASLTEHLEPWFAPVCETHAAFFGLGSIKACFDVSPCDEERFETILAWC